MDHLKEQLKKHYNKTELPEGLRQKLLTLEVPEPTPMPIRVNRKRLLAPIAAMLMAAVAILGGGKYLMDAVPPTAVPPTAVAPVESAAAFEDNTSMDMAPDPGPDIMSAAPDGPVTVYTEETPPEKTAPKPGSADVTAPQPPTSPEPTDPVPPDNITDPEPPPPNPPLEGAGSEDVPPQPPEEDVPPHDPGEGNEDEPPTEPGEDDPVDPPDDPPSEPGENAPVDPPVDDPVDPPDDPVNPPDDPINPEPPSMEIPVISGRYAYEAGQHIVHLTNRSTGESSPINVTTWVTESGYRGTHNLFGYMIEVSLIPKEEHRPLDSSSFYVVANVIM